MAYDRNNTTFGFDAIDAFTTIQARKASDARRAAIVAAAKAFEGRAYVSSPDRSECFDCVAMVNELTGADIPASWMDQGGALPFRAIDIADAQPGDILVFHRPDGLARQWNASVMTAADKHVGVPYARACGEMWLGSSWRPHLVAAYRVEA